jgi:NTE family protein
MSSIFLDSLATDIELLQRINATVSLVDQDKLAASQIKLQRVEVFVACPDTPLEGQAHRHVVNLPATIRFLMRSIGAMRKGGSVLASYLLFDKQYCRALIEMGYADTIARRAEVSVFFDPNASPIPAIIPNTKFNPQATQKMIAT